eukprot:TRINITY_DN71345_c0_g1_i1.p1 TRINITY_DN71345_c0_g1~~TRINITY_DN71345_c0_g1_i1.p1  ORF type:complete len:346 (+),score=63.56 TRINITY_DN71345_c0_g1_i1:199-1236(+)
MSSSEREAIQQSQITKRFVLRDQVIYRGLASTIFLGVEKDTLLQVGIKAVMKDRLESEDEKRQSLREVQLHAAIPPHANVLQLLAAEETPSAILLVTPYTPHGDLWELMRYGQTYCEQEVRNCAGQLLSALFHIHSVCDLIHGDIKPHNWLLFRVDGTHVVQLCDFGLAEHPDRPGGTITFRGLRGTSGWFAPEMLDHIDYGHAVDLFGVGLILFRLLGGYPPFDPPSHFTAIEFDERYWCHTTMPCRQLLAQLLSLQAADRGTAQSCFTHEWLSGPAPPEPSADKLQQLTAYGAPPSTHVLFWPPAELPGKERQKSYADLASMGSCDDDDEMGVPASDTEMSLG